MLRLGSKYQAEHLRNEAIRRLKQCFPDRLEDFKTYDTDSTHLDADGYVPNPSAGQSIFAKTSVSLHRIHCIPLIVMARSRDLESLLPTLFFTSLRLRPNLITAETGKSWSLANDDLTRWIRGQRCSRPFIVNSDGFSSQGLAPTVARSTVARASRRNTHRVWDDKCLPWMILLDSGYIDSLPGKYCQACNKELKQKYEEERLVTWKNLSKRFDLAPSLEGAALA